MPGRQVEPRDAFAGADLHGRQEAAEVVLDAREVHLVQDHVELARRPSRAVRGVPFPRGVRHELAERRVVVEAVERREVAQEVLVRRPARVDGDELDPRADDLGVRLRQPGLAGPARPTEDHEPAGGGGQVVPADQVVADPEGGVVRVEASDEFHERAIDRGHARRADIVVRGCHLRSLRSERPGSRSGIGSGYKADRGDAIGPSVRTVRPWVVQPVPVVAWAARRRWTGPLRPSSVARSFSAASSRSPAQSDRGASALTGTRRRIASRYPRASRRRERTPGLIRRSPAAAASSSASIDGWASTRSRAVFAPTPRTPGRPSEGSPRRIANSPYRLAGTSYFARTPASSSSKRSETPRTVKSSFTTGSRTSWIRSRSPDTISIRSSSRASTQNAPIASSASHPSVCAWSIPVGSSTWRRRTNCSGRPSGSGSRLPLYAG